MEVLILDLRGNPVALPAGEKVAELFLTEGVIVYKQGRLKEESHKAHNPDAFTMPLSFWWTAKPPAPLRSLPAR